MSQADSLYSPGWPQRHSHLLPRPPEFWDCSHTLPRLFGVFNLNLNGFVDRKELFSVFCGKFHKMLVFFLCGLVNVLLQVESPDGHILGGVARGCGLSPLCIFHGVFSAIITRGSFLVVTVGALRDPTGPETTVTQILSPPPWKLILSYLCCCRDRMGAALGRWLRTSIRAQVRIPRTHVKCIPSVPTGRWEKERLKNPQKPPAS